MQPYQKESQEIRRQGEAPIKALTTTASLAAAGIGSGIVAKRVLPFLSKFIPEEITKKGLSKIDPRFTSFINKSMEMGVPLNEIKDFIQGKITGSEQKISESEENEESQYKPIKNINTIKRYNDKLYSFIENEIKKGRSPLEAGALARMQEHFKKSIAMIEKNVGANWSDILISVFGNGTINNSETTQTETMPQNLSQKTTGKSEIRPVLEDSLKEIMRYL